MVDCRCLVFITGKGFSHFDASDSVIITDYRCERSVFCCLCVCFFFPDVPLTLMEGS